MQSLPDARQQTFEEIYGPPENFLEIEVCRLRAQLGHRSHCLHHLQFIARQYPIILLTVFPSAILCLHEKS